MKKSYMLSIILSLGLFASSTYASTQISALKWAVQVTLQSSGYALQSSALNVGSAGVSAYLAYERCSAIFHSEESCVIEYVDCVASLAFLGLGIYQVSRQPFALLSLAQWIHGNNQAPQLHRANPLHHLPNNDPRPHQDLYNGGPDLGSGGGLAILRPKEKLQLFSAQNDFQKLENRRGWLSDETINDYLNLLASEQDGTVVVTSFVYSTFVLRGTLMRLRATQTVPSRVLVPIHRDGDHWALLVIYQSGDIYYIDSLGYDAPQNLFEFSEQLAQFYGMPSPDFQMAVFTGREHPQRNDFDCGVFLLAFADVLMQRPQLVPSRDLTNLIGNRTILKWRRYIAQRIREHLL